MLTNTPSSFSLISKHFLPENIFSGLSKQNNKILVVAIAIFSTVATLFVICRYFKFCKINSLNSKIPSPIIPEIEKQHFLPKNDIKTHSAHNPKSPNSKKPTQNFQKTEWDTPKPNPPVSDKNLNKFLVNEKDFDFELAKLLQSTFDEKIEQFIPNSNNDTIIPIPEEPVIEEEILPIFSLNMEKFNQMSKTETKFQKLSEEEASNVLDIDPSLRTRPAAQEKLFAYHSLIAIHGKGVPERLDKSSNDELMKQVQFIIYTISQETKPKKQKELLLELAICVEDCLPVTQGKTSLMYMRLASVGKGLEKQIEQFISGYKDRIVDQVINQLFPDMQKPEYAQKYHCQPSKQFPHMKTGFLAAVGKELGLNVVGAETDPNKNKEDVPSKQNAFKKLFKEAISLEEIIKEFIIDVNGRNGQIDLDDLANWCKPENLGKEEAYKIFYNEDLQYPSYSPKYDEKKNGFAPYLTEKSAYLIFEKLGYIVGPVQS